MEIDIQLGLAYVGAYRSWLSMLCHCRPDHNMAKYYHERGITIHPRWRNFENFLADMGPRPAGTTLDRFPNNDGNYEPGNCRWATPLQQVHNRRAETKCRVVRRIRKGQKLTAQQVLDIRNRPRYRGFVKAVAAEFSVSRFTIQDILSGKRWPQERLICS